MFSSYRIRKYHVWNYGHNGAKDRSSVSHQGFRRMEIGNAMEIYST